MGQDQSLKIEHHSLPVSGVARRADRNPDVRIRDLTIDRHIGDDSDNTESLSVSFDELADRRFAAEEFLLCRLVDHGDKVGIALVLIGDRSAFDELKLKDFPVLAIRMLELRFD